MYIRLMRTNRKRLHDWRKTVLLYVYWRMSAVVEGQMLGSCKSQWSRWTMRERDGKLLVNWLHSYCPTLATSSSQAWVNCLTYIEVYILMPSHPPEPQHPPPTNFLSFSHQQHPHSQWQSIPLHTPPHPNRPKLLHSATHVLPIRFFFFLWRSEAPKTTASFLYSHTPTLVLMNTDIYKTLGTLP